ncbi:MAG: imidazoleglycerol-phosphate dehydratase HisB [Methanomicrobiales archaeon]|nr:imidazoleglycerol-phosphate dehydratase HisB [Methanomicrobiales archaeon]
MRKAEISRKTRETEVRVRINLDRAGVCDARSGIPFMDHMLSSMAVHGHLNLQIEASGDLISDRHHLVEDVGIVLGLALKQALGDAEGIARFGHAIVPMDESCALVALDLGGRGFLVFKGAPAGPSIDGIPREMIEHFFYSLCINAGITAHIRSRGVNDHHRCEAIFKAFGIALSLAVSKSRVRGIPSTKGSIG